MDANDFLVLALIGLAAGLLGGFVGVGGGVIIVPALMWFMGLTMHKAIGTSVAVMLPPIGILAAWNFYRSGDLNIGYASVIAGAFVIGGFFGSRLSIGMKESVHIVKLIFGVVMLYAAVRMIWSAIKTIKGG
jgi:hypothetical protein